MPTQRTGVVLVRLFSIYLVINALQTFFYFLPNMFTTDVGLVDGLLSASFWFLALGILLPAAFARWLWKNVEVVVPQENVSDESEMDLSRGMLLGVTLMGLWLLVWGLISLVRTESSLVATESMSNGLKLAQRAPYLAQIIVSLPLLFAKERIVAMLLWTRYAGRKKG